MKPLKALISKSTMHRAHSYKTLEPGDDLQDYDIVVVGIECHTDESNNEIEYGVYHKNTYIYYFDSRLSWHVLKDKYQWTYNNAYTHYILKVYRPYPGKENTLNPRNVKTINIKDLENSQDYYCIYSNPVLLKKFKLK